MAVGDGVALVAQGIDLLLSAPLPDSAAGLTELLAALEVQRNRLEAADQRLLAQALMSPVAAEFARSSLADVLVTVVRVDRVEAKRRIDRAEALGPRRALTGEPLPPVLPATAQAVAAGAVSAAQAEIIINCLDAIPAEAPAAAWPVAEAVLIDAAAHETPKQLRRTATALLARLNPDGLEPTEDQIERRRGFTLTRKPDGSTRPSGTWTAELTALWEAILDSLAAPHPVDGQPDTRTAAQRRHDAMLDAAHRLLRSGSLPDVGGIPVTVLATVTMAELEAAADGASKTGVALLGHGELISAKKLLELAAEAQLIPIVLNESGGIVAQDTPRRLASPGQRKLLIARDGGCCFPGCDRPPAWTEVHHITPHAANGPTQIPNLCLLCRYHHRSFEQAGWQVRMSTDHVPEWLPPPWLDPQRRPRRNTVHHRPHLDFRPPTAA